jgi:hypothetical protein
MVTPPFDYCKDGNNENFGLCDEPQLSCPSSQVQSSSAASQVVSSPPVTCGPGEQCYYNSTSMLCGKNETCCDSQSVCCPNDGSFCAFPGFACSPGYYCCDGSTASAVPGPGLGSGNYSADRYCYNLTNICVPNLPPANSSSQSLLGSSVTCKQDQQCYNTTTSKLCDLEEKCCSADYTCCTSGNMCYPPGSTRNCASGFCCPCSSAHPCDLGSGLGTTHYSAVEQCYNMTGGRICLSELPSCSNCTHSMHFNLMAGCNGTLCGNETSIVHCCI